MSAPRSVAPAPAGPSAPAACCSSRSRPVAGWGAGAGAEGPAGAGATDRGADIAWTLLLSFGPTLTDHFTQTRTHVNRRDKANGGAAGPRRAAGDGRDRLQRRESGAVGATLGGSGS